MAATRESRAVKALRASVLAYFVDQFDIYLPVVTLAPAVTYFQAEDLDPATTALLSALTFAATLVGRPLGAAVFGHVADTTGRKKATLVAVAGFGVTTLLIACLPGYEHIGMWSVGLLIGLRFVDGVFLGGEYTAAVPLAMESSPPQRRGVYSGIITGMAPAAISVTAALALLLLWIMPSDGAGSAYVQWGWRIPFLLGAILACVLFVAYRREVEETKVRRTSRTSPVLELFTGVHRGSLWQVFLLMSGAWFANNMVSAVLPGLLRTQLKLESTTATLIFMVAMAVAALSYPIYGHLSQRFGRRRFYLAYGVTVLVLGTGCYAVSTLWTGNAVRTGLFVTLTSVFVIGTNGPVAAYLTERFPAHIRASGYGIGYSLALIIPAFYGFYLDALDAVLPIVLAPLVLIALGGVLISAGGALGPETKDVVFENTVEEHRLLT